jgi:hypothetical protein
MHKWFAEEQLAIACDNDSQYVCGSQLFPAGHKLEEAVYCNHSLTCSSLVEANLYNANASTLSKLADSFAVSLCSSCGIEHLAPDRSEQLGCNQTVRTSAWQCWPLCSICSGHGVVPPQRKCRGTPAAAKRRVVGMKRKRKASSARVVPGGVALVGAVVAEVWAEECASALMRTGTAVMVRASSLLTLRMRSYLETTDNPWVPAARMRMVTMCTTCQVACKAGKFCFQSLPCLTNLIATCAAHINTSKPC